MRILPIVLLLSSFIVPFIAGAAEEGRNYPLGPIGGQYRISGGEAYARVVSLTAGAPGETAGLRVGDFILGAFGKPFSPTGSYHYGVSQDLGFAVDRAEGGSGALPLQVLRPGAGGMTITVNLPAAGAFGPAYPRNDAKHAAMYESSVAWLHSTTMSSTGDLGYFTGWTGLALLGHPNWNDATGAKPYRLSINKIRDFVIRQIYNQNYAPNENLLLDGTSNPNHLGGASNWELGQELMFLAEYWAKTSDANPVTVTVGSSTVTITVNQALQRGVEMCGNSVQWWKQPAQHSNGFSPEYSRVAGMCSHGGVTGDYMHQGWYCGINMTGVHNFNGMAFARRAGMDMGVRPKDGHYFGFNLNPGDPIPASIANALPASIALPQYGADPVLGATVTDPFWYDPSVNQKFLMQLNFLARRSAWYSAGHNEDGKVGYAPEAITHYDAGGRTPGTLLGMAMYQLDVGGLDSADLNRMESLKGYITRNFMKHQEAHAFCVGAQAFQAFCAPYLSDRQQRFFMDNWRFYFALSRTHTGGFQYFRSRSTADSYLNETHCAALNAALPYGIANGGYSLTPAYKTDRLLARFDLPDMTWPSLDARSLGIATTTAAIPFQMVDGNGLVVDPANYTATWTKLSGAGAVSFGPGTTFSDQALLVYNQNNPPDASNLPSAGYGNYRGFSFRPNDTALTTVGGSLAAPDLLLGNMVVRRSASAGSGSSAAYLKVYSSATPSTATWIGDSTNTANTNGGISDANLSFSFNSLPIQAGTIYYFYFANTPGNLNPGAITWTTGRLVASNNSGHTYSSGNLINTSWAATDTSYDAVFSSSIQMRTYSSPATNSDTLTFPADNTYRIQLTVSDGTRTVVEPIDVIVNTTPPVTPPSTMVFTSQPQPASVAPGGTVILTVATSGPSPALYQWRRNGVAVGGASTSPSLTLSNVSGGAEGEYDCVYTTSLGTLTSNSAHVSITGTGGNIPGGLWQEIYTGISGDTVSSLTANSKYPNFSDSSGPITSAASTTNYSDSYGQRWTGWITPAVSGNFRFYLASDDSSELWLGTNDLPASATRILTLSGYTGEKQWSARSPSAYIAMTAGTRYYIELRHKEGSGGDHCALAWQLSGNSAPVNGSGEIPGSMLSYRIGGIYNDIQLENIAPAFAADPMLRPKAFDGRSYTATIAGSAADPNSGSILTYSRVAGPAWLSVASDGTLSGTPATADLGINSFTVRVTDQGGLTDDSTLQIEVDNGANHPPAFISDPLVFTTAAAMAPYTASLAGSAVDDDIPNGDSLTFNKVGGPAWLSVGADGSLIGTPALSDTGTNQFSVRVVDSQGGEDTAALTIEVGPANFTYDLNSTVAGSGAAAGGTWDGTAQWSGDPNGMGSAFAWADGATAVFAAGVDATSDYTVTNSAARVIGGFTARSGRPLVTGGMLQTTAAQSPFHIEATALGARIDSPIIGSGGLFKTGTGTLVLGGSNTFTGNLTVSSGVLELTSTGKLYNSGFNNTAVVTVNSGGTWRMPSFNYAGVGQLADYAQRRVLNGGTIEVTGNTHSSGQNFTTAAAGGTFRYTPSGQTLTLSGNTNSDIPLNGPLTIHTGGNIIISEAITGAGSLTKTGAADLVLRGSNTFSGPVTLSAGDLVFDGANTENGAPELILNGGTFYLGSAFAGGSATFGALSGSAAISVAYGQTTGTRTLSISQTTDTTYSGVISDAAARLAGLAKTGGGTLTLTAASTYTGATSVNGGTLRVNGSLGNTTTSVAAAGTLGGSGSIGGAVTVNGTLAPGNNTIGTLTTGALTLAPGASMEWEISDWTGAAGIGHDTVTATSLNLTATAANPVTLRLIGASPANFSESTARFTLVQTSGAISGFNANQFVVDASGLTLPQGTWTVEQSGNSLVLVYADFTNPDANQNGIQDTWETNHFGNADPGMNGANEDPDHDDLANLMEFALDTHPLQSGPSPLTHTLAAAIGGSFLQLDVPKNPVATNLVYRVEVTGDLNGAWSSDILTAVEIIRDDAERLIARDRTPVSNATRRFIRLRVTSAP